jgi:radical SAM protein with 4Fe4S-binding SPASM domain
MFEDCYVLKITNKCNNGCWFCPEESSNHYFKSLLQIKNEIDASVNKNIIVVGGEPTLHKDFFTIMSMAGQKFLDVYLITNGRAIAMPSFLEKVKDMKIIFIVKIQGHNHFIHDSITRAEKSFTQSETAIQSLLESKRKISILYPINELNFIFLDRIIDMHNKKGVESIIVENIYPVGACKENFRKLAVRYSELKEVIKNSIGKSHKPIYLLNFPRCIFDFTENQINIRLHNTGHNKPLMHKVCQSCIKNAACSQVTSDYIEIFGQDEIKPTYDRPNEICFEVTAKCNLECPFCFNKTYYSDGDLVQDKLSTQDIKRIIDKLEPDFVEQIRITGGEPLLRKDIFQIMRYIRAKGFRIWLNTNGTLIDEKNAKEIAKYVENVLIPLNGFDSASDKVATGKDNFEKKIEAIKLLQKERVKVVRCGTVATEKNIDNLGKFYSLVLKLGIDDWELYRPILQRKEDVEKVRRSLIKLCTNLSSLNKYFDRDYKIANAVPFCFHDPIETSKVCIGAGSDDGITRFVISADGVVRPSYFISENLGNALEDDLSTIWKSGFLYDIRNLKYVDNDCVSCNLIERCKGGSRYFAKLYFGKYNAKDPLMVEKNVK